MHWRRGGGAELVPVFCRSIVFLFFSEYTSTASSYIVSKWPVLIYFCPSPFSIQEALCPIHTSGSFYDFSGSLHSRHSLTSLDSPRSTPILCHFSYLSQFSFIVQGSSPPITGPFSPFSGLSPPLYLAPVWSSRISHSDPLSSISTLTPSQIDGLPA